MLKYGVFDLSDGSINTVVHGKEIFMERLTKKVIKYCRKDNGSVEFEAIINGDGVAIYPYTVHEKEDELSTFIYLRFTKSLSLAPGASFKIYVKTPIDVGVYGTSKSKLGLIDLIKPKNLKYGVYGPLVGGVLARYYKVTPSSKPIRVKTGEILYPLRITNDSGIWINISKIIVPFHTTKVFIKGYEAFTEVIYVFIKSRLRATIELVNDPPKQGMTELPTLPKRALKSISYEMEWGV